MFRVCLKILSINLVLLFSNEATGQFPAQKKQVVIKLSDSAAELSLSKSGIQKIIYTSGIDELDIILSEYGITGLRKIADLNSFKKIPLNHPLERYLILEIEPEDVISFLGSVQGIGSVEYADTLRSFRVEKTSDDPLISGQYYLNQIHAQSAWEIQAGDRDIIVGVLDTGIDYTHPDLQNKIWINDLEDINSNGVFDQSDLNGIDEDGNGYVDDVIGWDFTDSPEFPDDGDHIDEDADPMDEHGHGTRMSGIIAAERGNGIGISGIAPGVRIMALRAGTKKGYLEEDDVARAIIYAVQNGAGIINMSFGDVSYSMLMKDIIRFAYKQGCILVASAGNSGIAEGHFPSGFDEVISAGSVNENSIISGFSNIGSSVDITAPGEGLLTTVIGGGNSNSTGTSASCAVISGAAALLLSEFPDSSPDEIRSILTMYSADHGSAGWDPYFGAGIVDVYSSLAGGPGITANLSADIIEKPNEDIELILTGSVFGGKFSSYNLSYSLGEISFDWIQLQSGTTEQISGDTLGGFLLEGIPDTTVFARLEVTGIDNKKTVRMSRIEFNRKQPEIYALKSEVVWIEDKRGLSIDFETDIPSRGKLYYRTNGIYDFHEVAEEGDDTDHSFLVDMESSAEIEWYVSAESNYGKTVIDDNNGSCYLGMIYGREQTSMEFTTTETNMPNGYLLQDTTDFDNDGKREIILTEIETDGSYGSILFYEYNQGVYDLIDHTFPGTSTGIPRSVGDSDGDGLMELLIGIGDRTLIYEQNGPNDYPGNLIFTSEDDLWGSVFYDIDNDGIDELFAHYQGIWGLFKLSSGLLQQLAEFHNPTSGSNTLGVPHIEIGDFNNDSKPDILYGDYDGDIIVYEMNTVSDWQNSWSVSLDGIDAIDFVFSGDFRKNSYQQFGAAVRKENDPYAGSSSKEWKVYIFEKSISGGYSPIDSILVSGVVSPAEMESGIMVSSGRLFMSLYPDLYVFEFNEPSGSYFDLSWYYKGSRSSRLLTTNHTVSGNGLYFSTGNEVIRADLESSFSKPAAPYDIRIFPFNSSTVRLDWEYQDNVDQFRIFRGGSAEDLSIIAIIDSTSYFDHNLTEGLQYWYAVTSVDSSYDAFESSRTETLSAIPNKRPELASVEYVDPGFIIVKYNEEMNETASDLKNYCFSPDLDVSSCVFRKGRTEVILSLNNKNPPAGNYSITTGAAVSDILDTPISTIKNASAFIIPESEAALIISHAEKSADYTIDIEFSIDVDSVSAVNPGNYLVNPDFTVTNAELLTSRTVRLTLSGNSYLGALGKIYTIIVDRISSLSGRQIVFGLEYSLSITNDDPSTVFVYPNPVKIGNGSHMITFANLPPTARITIFDPSGRKLIALEENNGDGGVSWDMKDSSGNLLASGVYFYIVEAGGKKVRKKFAVIR